MLKAMWVLWILNRAGILTSTFWSAVTRGDVAGAMDQINGSLNANLTSTQGVALTISGSVALAVVTLAVKILGKGAGIPVRGKITRITA